MPVSSEVLLGPTVQQLAQGQAQLVTLWVLLLPALSFIGSSVSSIRHEFSGKHSRIGVLFRGQ